MTPVEYNLTSDEIETHISQTKADRAGRKIWEVFTNDPYWIKRFTDQGAKLIKVVHGGGHFFELEHRQVTIRSRGKKTRPRALRRPIVSSEISD